MSEPRRIVTKEDIDRFFEPEFYDLLIPFSIGAEKGYDNDQDG